MGGESREGWIPWIGRQYNDFKSMLPSVPKSIYDPNPAPPMPADVPSALTYLRGNRPETTAPTSWQGVADNFKNEGSKLLDSGRKLYGDFQEAAKDPVRSNLRSGYNYYKSLITPENIDRGNKIMGAVGAVTTAPFAAATKTAWDVVDPLSTGSEKKPASDIIWETAKAVKHGLMDPTAEQPELARELGKRAGPTMLNDIYERNPAAYYGAKFALNNADFSNVIPEKAIAAGVGGLAHGAIGAAKLLGMAGDVNKEAMVPMDVIKWLHGIGGFSHGTDSAGDARKMLNTGVRPSGALDDVMGRWTSVGVNTPEETARAAREGRQPSSRIADMFASTDPPMQMDVKDPKALVMDYTRPMPREDLDFIIAKLDPVEDRQLILKLETKWNKTKHAVIPDAELIRMYEAGEPSPLGYRHDPTYTYHAWEQDVRSLEETLLNAQAAGRDEKHGRTGRGALNTPSTNPDVGAVLHHDVGLGQDIDDLQLSIDPAFAKGKGIESVNEPWQDMRRSTGKLDASGQPIPATTPWDKEPPPPYVPSFVGSNSPANLTNKVVDFKYDVAENNAMPLKAKFDAWHALDPAVQDHYKVTYPQSHANMQSQMTATGYVPPVAGPSGQIQQAADTLADTFHQNFVTGGTLTDAEIIENFKKLAPAGQKAYESKYPTIYQQLIAPHLSGPPGVQMATDVDVNSIKDILKDNKASILTGGSLHKLLNNATNMEPEALYKGVADYLKSVGKHDAADEILELIPGSPGVNHAAQYINMQVDALEGLDDGTVTASEAKHVWDNLLDSEKLTFTQQHPALFNKHKGMLVGSNVAAAPKPKSVKAQAFAFNKTALAGDADKIKAEWAALPDDVKEWYKKDFIMSYGQNVEQHVGPGAVAAPGWGNIGTTTPGGVPPVVSGPKKTVQNAVAADKFYSKVAGKASFTVEEKAKQFAALPPEVQQAFKDQFPGSHQLLEPHLNVGPVAVPKPLPGSTVSPNISKTPAEAKAEIETYKSFTADQKKHYNDLVQGGGYSTQDAYNVVLGKPIGTPIADPTKLAAKPANLKGEFALWQGPLMSKGGQDVVHEQAKLLKEGASPAEVQKFWDEMFSVEQDAFKANYPSLYSQHEATLTGAPAPKPVDVYNPGSGETHATFHTKEEAEAWMAQHPEGKYLNIGGYEPTEPKAKDYTDFTKPGAVAQPTTTKLAPVASPAPAPQISPAPTTTKGAGDFTLKKAHVEGGSMGMHEKHIYTKGGQDYLFKPNHGPDFVPHMEVTANKVATLGGLYPIDIDVKDLGGETGTIQSILGNKTDWPSLRTGGDSATNVKKLSTSQLKDIIKNHPVDWLTANHDAHGGQWLVTPTGIIEVDRGQAFKHFGDDSLKKTYNPNAKFGEDPSIYITIHKLWKEGKLPQLTEQDIASALSGTIGHLNKNSAEVTGKVNDALDMAGKSHMSGEADRRFRDLHIDMQQFWAK